VTDLWFAGRFLDMSMEMGEKAGRPISSILYWPGTENSIQFSTTGMFCYAQEGDLGIFIPATHRRGGTAETEEIV